jgi:hypothetical protein
VIVEHAADAAHLLAMRQEEILLAPLLVAGVVGDRVRSAGGLHGSVEGNRIGVGLGAPGIEHGRQIAPATEPPFAGDDKTRVHMRCRHVGIQRMGDERNARRPEARIVVGARDLLAELRREFAVHRGGVNAGLLEHAPLDDPHDATAAGCATMILAVPRRAYEAAGGTIAGGSVGGQIGLDLLEGRT